MLFCALGAAAALLVLVAVFPQGAHANFADIAIDAINNTFKDGAKGLMIMAFEWISSVNTGMLTNPFDSLFSNGGDGAMAGPGLDSTDSVYRKVSQVASGLTGTLGYSILAIATIVQICKMAGRADGNQQLASVKELAFILIYFAVFKALIDNAVPFCEAFYNVFNGLLKTYFTIGQTPGVDNAGTLAQTAVDSFDNNGLAAVGFAFVVMLACLAAVVISYAVVFFRSVQIYLYTAFAPVALPLLALDETRSFGTGFIRNYIALLLSGLIISFMIIVFPYILAAATLNTNGFLDIAAVLAVCVVLCLGIARSGGMAKEILGG